MPQTVRLSPSMEDYLKKIFSLCSADGHAHITDIASSLSLSKPSVHRAVMQLRDAGLVLQEPYGQVTMTEAGTAYAQGLLRRHILMKRFLTEALGVSESRAEAEACGLEHAISRDTADKLSDFLANTLDKLER